MQPLPTCGSHTLPSSRFLPNTCLSSCLHRRRRFIGPPLTACRFSGILLALFRSIFAASARERLVVGRYLLLSACCAYHPSNATPVALLALLQVRPEYRSIDSLYLGMIVLGSSHLNTHAEKVLTDHIGSVGFGSQFHPQDSQAAASVDIA